MSDHEGFAPEEARAREEGVAPSPAKGCDDLEFVPDMEEFMNFQSSSSSANESEYYTDEELGEAKGKKKKMKLRELSSDGSLSSSDEGTGRHKKGKKRMKAVPSKYNDDGCRHRYLTRIRLVVLVQYLCYIASLCVTHHYAMLHCVALCSDFESQQKDHDSEEFPDRKLEGGFTVPGNVWYRLYK